MRPRISIVIPWHFMSNWEFFLKRCLKSIESQTFTDNEVIMTKAGSMPINTNRSIECSKGELIKVLYMDDYLSHNNSLQEISDEFTKSTRWLVTGCSHMSDDWTQPQNYHKPEYTHDILTGNNRIGSPSVLTMRRGMHKYFDENLSYLLDCDLYKRLYDAYSYPTILDTNNVTIGLHQGQTSNLMPLEAKQQELIYLTKKYE